MRAIERARKGCAMLSGRPALRQWTRQNPDTTAARIFHLILFEPFANLSFLFMIYVYLIYV